MKAAILRLPYQPALIPPAPIAKLLFADRRISWLWLLLRCYVGYEWLTSGLDKLTGYSFTFDSFGVLTKGGSWILNASSGNAIQSFAGAALKKAAEPNASVQGWYATFLHSIVLPNATLFSYVITFGELLVGLGLIVGAFTGIAAFFGMFMNLNYLFSGSISVNPTLAVSALLLVLAWRTAGYLGLDYLLIPLLGTPWTKKQRATENTQVVAEGETPDRSVE